MHKFAILLIGILSVLLLGEMKNTQSAPILASEIRIDRAAEDQWLCERRNNSDLILTRIVCEVAPPQQYVIEPQQPQRMGKSVAPSDCGFSKRTNRANQEIV